MAGSGLRAGLWRMNPLPIQPAKIHCPLARDDTLTRERLNSWVERAVAGRLALIVAEAGFGKTTLLADWARHTRRMTAWYRLESDDRDWLTFIRHVVAGGRELDPEFAPDTFALLMALESGGATQQDIVVSLAREVAAFGTGSVRGFTLILDDYHVIDGFAETEPIVRALLDRTGPGFSVVISTRTAPRLSLGRVRARGGVMTLEGSDLCFDVDETTRLFRDAYHRPLDEDIVSDLWDRTEGWAALLTLVRTGLEDEGHQDARDLVAHLDASHGDLYEFLADEVLASLSPELQSFLKRVALLTGVDVASAVLASDLDVAHVTAAIADCERLGLLTRPDRESPHRFHPLVREFLVARLTSEIGPEAVRDIHASLAQEFERDDWIAAAWHYRAAGNVEAAATSIDRAIPAVIAEGHLDQVRQFLDGSAGSQERAGALLLRSRLEVERGNLSRAMQLAEHAASLKVGGALAGPILLTLAASGRFTGLTSRGSTYARALEAGLTPADRQVAEASVVVSGTQTDGDMAAAADYLTALAFTQDQAGHSRYAGVTRLNLALILLWQGRNREALRAHALPESLLATNAQSPERAAAAAVRVSALVQLGNVDELLQLAKMADEVRSPIGREEAAMETARLAADYGSLSMAETYLSRMGTLGEQYGYKGSRAAIAAAIGLRRGDPEKQRGH